MVTTEDGRVGLGRRTHPQKALLPMLERELPIEMSERRGQSRKAELPIVGVVDARETWNRRSHPQKAPSGIANGPLVVSDRILSQLEKALAPND